MAKRALVTSAAVAGLIGRTVALAVSVTSQCDVSEYYDVSTGACRHCDTACFQHENGIIVGFLESRCLQLCPGYIKEPRVPQYPREPEKVALTLMEGCLIGFVLSLFIVCLLVLVVLRAEIFTALKDCVHSAPRDLSTVTDLCRHNDTGVSESSYVKLADPSDDVVVIIDRVTTV
ncbi:hypothetical protein ACOMHN_054801 [Nucella lapillus]